MMRLTLHRVDAQFACNGTLAVACVVPGPYRLLYAWRLG
jgi:hypothetical protein